MLRTISDVVPSLNKISAAFFIMALTTLTLPADFSVSHIRVHSHFPPINLRFESRPRNRSPGAIPDIGADIDDPPVSMGKTKRDREAII